MSAQNRTHPFVIGMITALFVQVVYLSAPTSPWETMIIAAKLVGYASVVAILEWWSRKPDLLEKDDTDL